VGIRPAAGRRLGRQHPRQPADSGTARAGRRRSPTAAAAAGRLHGRAGRAGRRGAVPPLLAAAAPLAGLCLGPTLATLFSGAAGAAPQGSGTEAQAWVNSIMNGGAAGGAALAGLAAARPLLGLALAAATAAAAAGSATVHIRE
jgi:hypothetical protein